MSCIVSQEEEGHYVESGVGGKEGDESRMNYRSSLAKEQT